MQNLIRVLHTEWSNGWGGQEIRIINEMIAVRDEGVDVFLACRDDSIIKKKALENNIKVFTLPFKGNVDFKTLLSLSKIIKANSIDIVNTHSGKDTWVGGLAAKLAGVRFIRTRHLSNRINPARTNFINELADYVFTTGEVVKADMIKYNRIKFDKIQSIPTGIDSSIFDPDQYDRKSCRDALNLNNDEIAVGIVAVLRQFKRHDLFLMMAKELISKYPKKKFTFLIAGDGPQKENIKKVIKDLGISSNITLLGHVNLIPELLCALDICVLSSDSKEGVPQSVMQALFMNKMMVATKSGSTEDLLINENFQIVETNSIEALVDGVSYFVENGLQRVTRPFMISSFSSAVMVEKILNVYNSILR